MARMTGGDLIADFLIKAEVPYVFGICGHGNVGLLESLHERQDKIKLISPRHEQTAAHMADAYFRVSHKVVATLTSCGPGSANIVMGTACAFADSSAFLAITANVPTSQFNRGPFQETYRHQQGEFPAALRPYIKRSYQPTRVDMLPLALRQGLTLAASGRPGPVNIDIPFNLFGEEEDVEVPDVDLNVINARPGASPEHVRRAADMLMASERPLLFVGHGMTLAHGSDALTELVDLLGLPVASSPNGMGTLDMNHPLSLGFIGRNGTYPANQSGRHCDVLMAIGARFDDRSSSSWIPGYSWNIPNSKLIHVDIDVTEIGRNYPVELGIVADARIFLEQLVAELRSRKLDAQNALRTAWHEAIAGWQREWQEFTAPAFTIDSAPLRPERVVAEIQKVIPDNAIIAFDAGVHHNWFMQFYKTSKPQTTLHSWGFSAMGFGVSGILGAKLAAPDRPCIAVVGDGGFTMTPHVLCTAVEFDIPVIWVIWNNFAWGAIRDIQYGLFEGREIGTAFYSGPNQTPYNPDFAAMARSCGVHGITVTHSDQLGGALQQALALGKACVIDVHVDANIRPPSTGTWHLPPVAHPEPKFGAAWTPETIDG